MRARYTGPIRTTFEAPVNEVFPGDTFDVPQGREPSFLQHGYVEPADKAAKDFVKNTNEPPEPEPDSLTS